MDSIQTIDENLYSRQLYVLGHKAMENLSNARVLLSGLGGLGNEIAKNLVLSGIKSLVLHDTKTTTIHDLGTQYYLSEAQIGLNRAVCNKQLAELNSYVDVTTYDGELTEEYLVQFDVVVMTEELDEQELIRINKIVRNNGIFIMADSRSVFGRIFCDFGIFDVYDINGEEPFTSIVEDVDGDVVRCIEPHNLSSDDLVTFVNSETVYSIEVIDRFSVKIPNLEEGGDIIKQVKKNVVLEFNDLETSLREPEFVLVDYLNFERPQTLHNIYSVIHSDNLIQEVEKLQELSDKEREVVEQFSLTCNGQVMATHSVIGGMVAQEVLKAVTHKFTPIKQWLYFDSFDSLPETHESNYTNTRYDSHIEVFGNDMQEKLSKLNMFVVGAGAIGCELLKNFAMSGIASDSGRLVVTDMDIIEKSNLNRQFLFRSTDIGQQKSVTASIAVKHMNPDVNIIAHSNFVGPSSENIYNSKFYNDTDIIANALDNVEARKYVDSQCVLYNRPLLESGTLGTKGNVQVIVPNLTESYGSMEDPPEKDIPLCTIKNFPNSINHTIQWARDQFEWLFTNAPENAMKYINDPESIKSLPLSDLYSIVEDIEFVLVKNRPEIFEDCIKFAYRYWHKQYRDQIKQLVHQYPKDNLTSEGTLFWSGAKKFPNALRFNDASMMHIGYVLSYANLWANVFRINDRFDDYDKVLDVILETGIPEYMPNKRKISATDEEEKEKTNDCTPEELLERLDNISSRITNINTECLILNPLKFEKDDDTNYHIDFITNASNLRACNYGIELADKHKTKGIAGKIIPAIATTTSVVAGLVMLELYKLVNKCDNIEKYRNTYLNLALPLMSFSEPGDAPKYTVNGKIFNMWDTIDIEEEMDLGDLCTYIYEYLGGEVEMLLYKSMILYSFYSPPSILNRRVNMKISDIIQEITKEPLDKDVIKLTVSIEMDDDEDEDILLPDIKYRIK